MVDKKGLFLFMAVGALCLSQLPAHADTLNLSAGNLVVTRSVYTGTPASVAIGQALPGGGVAVADGSYPGVWANETPDPSFGITSPIMLDQYTTGGVWKNSFNLTDALAAQGINLATSFPSKSELAINESAGGALTLMGYLAPANALDVSNSNTPNHLDPTNPVGLTYQRAVAQINPDATLQVTPVDTYSGNNGRAAVLAGGSYFMVGNAGNGSGTEPANIVDNTGVQTTTPGGSAEAVAVGVQQGTSGASKGFQFGYSVVQNGNPADKSGKDNNLRGLTVFNNTLYATKGSGSNGSNTVYQVGTAGTLPNVLSAATATISILPGFSTVLASATSSAAKPVYHPFGIWFANANTLYVADEGDAVAYTSGTKTHFGGLQKWICNGTTWSLAYTLQNGLNLGTKYGVANYPSSYNPATDGLRNITGRVNGDGTATIYGITSTVSAATDQGADPNLLVSVTDNLAASTPATVSGESFTTLASANYGEVLRGVTIASAPIAPIRNISSQVAVTTSGFLYNRATRLYGGTLTVTNQGSATVSGNLAVTLDNLSAGVALTNASGTASNGSPFVASAVSLAPGATTTYQLKFSDPANLLIHFDAATTLQ